MENIEVLDFRDFYILVSKVNGNNMTVSRDMYLDKDTLNHILKDNGFYIDMNYPEDFDRDLFKTVYISLNTSSQCNLKCTYCFKKDRENRNLTFEESKKFIDMILDEYPNAGKYIVDPTGSGEPLLNRELLYKIGEYCKEKSNELRREVLPMIVTNGTLLNKDTVQEIRGAGILFGVSLDGDRKDNDYYRKDTLGQGVYKKVIKNVKNIKDRSLMGVAVTLTDKNTDLVKILKHLIKYFPTISIKPVRSVDGSVGIDESNIDEIKREYARLYEFLLSETMKGNLEYIAADDTKLFEKDISNVTYYDMTPAEWDNILDYSSTSYSWYIEEYHDSTLLNTGPYQTGKEVINYPSASILQANQSSAAYLTTNDNDW